MRRPSFMPMLLAVLLSTVPGCATLRGVAALRQVEFRFDRISGASIAGISLSRIASYEDLTALELGRLGLAIASKDVPLDIVVHLEGRNPETNNVTARLVAMDWAYLLEDRETVTGRLDRAYDFPPGTPMDLPLDVSVNLALLFGSDGRDLVESALILSGLKASTKHVALRIAPTVETPIGPIRYPVPITLAVPKAPAR